MKTKNLILAAFALASFLNPQLSALRAQGSLTPPGAPAPTMKSLDQIEARTPIDTTHTPGNVNNQFIISTPGSYYLTGNINGSNGLNGISIKADNVTLDLNGFALIGVPGSVNGILVPSPQRNLRVRNGSIQSWGGNGIDCSLASNSQFDHLRASQNATGLNCGTGCLVTDCCAETNHFGGIGTSDRCTLSACNAENNTLGEGIITGSYCTVTACTAVANSDGFNIQNGCTIIACTAIANKNQGIFPSSFCTIKDCTASANLANGINAAAETDSVIVNCSASGNTTGGILGGFRATITGCTACGNTGGDGIVVDGDSLVSGNNASLNVNGIHTTSSFNRIDGNTANHNTHYGILWGGDLMMRNSAFLNGTNYNPAAGTGNSGPLGSASSSTDPWSNF